MDQQVAYVDIGTINIEGGAWTVTKQSTLKWPFAPCTPLIYIVTRHVLYVDNNLNMICWSAEQWGGWMAPPLN